MSGLCTHEAHLTSYLIELNLTSDRVSASDRQMGLFADILAEEFHTKRNMHGREIGMKARTVHT